MVTNLSLQDAKQRNHAGSYKGYQVVDHGELRALLAFLKILYPEITLYTELSMNEPMIKLSNTL